MPHQDKLTRAMEAHTQGDAVLAETLYREILQENPRHADAMALFGVLLSDYGHHETALALIGQAITLDPSCALFALQLGNAWTQAGDDNKAADAFRAARALQPDWAVAHYNLGNAQHRLGALDEARQSYSEAVIHDPAYVDAWLNLARLAEQEGDYTLSRDAARQAAERAPDNAAAFFVLGVAFTRLRHYAEAEQAYRAAVSLKPDWADAWDNLGLVCQFMNRLEEAEESFNRCLALSGQTLSDAQIQSADEKTLGTRNWHLAQLELMKGDYKRGFARYRCRFGAPDGLKRMEWAQPYWRGEDIRGKTLLVLDEEGRDDGLMMARYLPWLRAQGVRVKFYIRPVMATLFKEWDGADEVIAHGDPIGAFDIYSWVFDLPYCCGTTLDTIPVPMPYLPVLPPDDHTRLPPTAKLKIGVVWAGSVGQQAYSRHIPLVYMATLFERERFQFYNLTRDKHPADDGILAHYPVIDLAPRLRDFGDLARFVNQMDLIISCDTATPHLAGGMNKPTWLLLPHSCDWCWLTKRVDSPWYPSLRLFRQPHTGDWKNVFAQVKDAVAAL